jgi:hypothetical protein
MTHSGLLPLAASSNGDLKNGRNDRFWHFCDMRATRMKAADSYKPDTLVVRPAKPPNVYEYTTSPELELGIGAALNDPDLVYC